MNVNSFQSAIALRTFENLVKTYCEVVGISPSRLEVNAGFSDCLRKERFAKTFDVYLL